MDNKSTQLKMLYKLHSEELYRFCYFKTHSKETAEDIVSEAFIALYKADFDSIQNPRAWLYKVCRNSIYDVFYKGAGPRTSLLENPEDFDNYSESVDVAQIALDEAAIELIKKELEKLDQVSSEIILLKLWEEMSFKEIADITELKENAVKQRFYRGLESVKVNLEANKSYRLNAVNLPIIAAGVIGISKLPAFHLTNNLLQTSIMTAIGAAAAGSAAVGGGIISTASAKIVATLVATGAITFGGIAGVSYVNNQNNQANKNTEQSAPVVPDEVENPSEDVCTKTYANEKYAVSFDYNSCLWSIEPRDSVAVSNMLEIHFRNKNSQKKYEINLNVQKDYPFTENLAMFCGDDFKVIATRQNQDMARVRSYAFGTNNEIITYSTESPDLNYPRAKTIEDVDGSTELNTMFTKRITENTNQVMCVSNLGVAYSTNTSTAQMETVRLGITGNITDITETELKEIDKVAKSITFSARDQSLPINSEEENEVKLKTFTNDIYNLSFKYPESMGDATLSNDGYEGTLVVQFSQSNLKLQQLSAQPMGDLSMGSEYTEIQHTESFESSRGESITAIIYTCVKAQPSFGICIWVPFSNDGITFSANRLGSLDEAKEYIGIIKLIDTTLVSGVKEYFDSLTR